MADNLSDFYFPTPEPAAPVDVSSFGPSTPSFTDYYAGGAAPTGASSYYNYTPASYTPTTYTPTFDFSSYYTPPAGPMGAESYYSYTPPTTGFADLPAFGATEAKARVSPFVSGGAGGFVPNLYTTPAGPPMPTYEEARQAGAAPEAAGLFGLKGLSTGDLLKAALGIGGGLMGMQAQQKAAEEAAAARREFQQASEKAAADVRGLAQPYLTQGGAALSMAAQGALSPAQQQQYQAAQARLAQEAARSGGVGAIQTQQALQNMYQQALQNQQTMALQLLGPGNELAYRAVMENMRGTQGGLQMELQLAQAANQASMNMYGALASMIGGQSSGQRSAA